MGVVAVDLVVAADCSRILPRQAIHRPGCEECTSWAREVVDDDELLEALGVRRRSSARPPADQPEVEAADRTAHLAAEPLAVLSQSSASPQKVE